MKLQVLRHTTKYGAFHILLCKIRGVFRHTPDLFYMAHSMASRMFRTR